MVELQAMLMFLLMTSKNIFLQIVTSLKEYRRTLTIISRRVESTMLALGKNLTQSDPLELLSLRIFWQLIPRIQLLVLYLKSFMLVKKDLDITLQNRLTKLKNRPDSKDDNNNLSLPPSPPLFPPVPPPHPSQPPPSFSQRPSPTEFIPPPRPPPPSPPLENFFG